MSYAIGFIIAVLVLIELRFWTSLRGTSAEKKLSKLCLGDNTQVDRLIAREQQRNPKLSRKQAVRAAIAAYKRDNR